MRICPLIVYQHCASVSTRIVNFVLLLHIFKTVHKYYKVILGY